MSGKGSRQRPQQISDEEAAANWARVFGSSEKESKESKCQPEASEKAPDESRE
jgi:hypothetical protein